MIYTFIKTKLILSIVITMLMAMSTPCAAATFDPSTAALGARPMGLGGAFVGIADDSNAIFYNPAGLAGLDKWSATSMYTKLLDTVDYRMLGGTYNTQYGTFGIGYIGTSTPSGLQTGVSTTDVGSLISFDTNTILISYGNRLSNLFKIAQLPADTSIGATLKVLSQGFSGGGQDGKSGTAFNLDLGITATVTPWAKAGVTINNVIPASMSWSSGLTEDRPRKLNIGGALNLMGDPATSLYKADKPLVGVLDASFGFAKEDGFTLHGGLEWTPLEYLKLRCGVDQVNGADGSAINLTAGVGFNYQGISFDYAYFQDTTMTANQSHYFSISYAPVETVNKPVAEKVTEKKVSSDGPVIIKGGRNVNPDEYSTNDNSSNSGSSDNSNSQLDSYYGSW